MNYVYNGVLYHHGVLGQKWGIRRYQRKDGSLTKAGKKRYSNIDAQTLERRASYDLQIDNSDIKDHGVRSAIRQSVVNATPDKLISELNSLKQLRYEQEEATKLYVEKNSDFSWIKDRGNSSDDPREYILAARSSRMSQDHLGMSDSAYSKYCKMLDKQAEIKQKELGLIRDYVKATYSDTRVKELAISELYLRDKLEKG